MQYFHVLVIQKKWYLIMESSVKAKNFQVFLSPCGIKHIRSAPYVFHRYFKKNLRSVVAQGKR